MDFYQLKYLKEIYYCRSYTKAAEILEHTPSALTIAMQKLEAELGVTLFIKKGRIIEPSEACKKLISIIEHTLDDTIRLYDVARGIAQDKVVTIRLGIPDSFPLVSIGEIKSNFVDDQVEIQIRQSNQRQLEEELASGVLDMSILRRPLISTDRFSYTDYSVEEFYGYCSTDSEYAYLEALTPEIIADSFLIFNNEIDGFPEFVENYLKSHSCKPKNICKDSLSSRSAFALAIAEGGINIAPWYRYRPDELIRCSITPPLTMSLVIGWDKYKTLNQYEVKLIDILISHGEDGHGKTPTSNRQYFGNIYSGEDS